VNGSQYVWLLAVKADTGGFQPTVGVWLGCEFDVIVDDGAAAFIGERTDVDEHVWPAVGRFDETESLVVLPRG
jgi:hypothetical protein